MKDCICATKSRWPFMHLTYCPWRRRVEDTDGAVIAPRRRLRMDAREERDAITRDRVWASGYAAGRAAAFRGDIPVASVDAAWEALDAAEDLMRTLDCADVYGHHEAIHEWFAAAISDGEYLPMSADVDPIYGGEMGLPDEWDEMTEGEKRSEYLALVERYRATIKGIGYAFPDDHKAEDDEA